jgi:tetratricopeptide (TPR) repeat protein
VDSLLSDVRQEADDAARSAWTSPAREHLGTLYYRACELLTHGSERDLERASALFKMTTEAYRQTDNRDVLAVALGMWSAAALRAGDAEQALSLAREGAELLAGGAPSLLNESTVYLALSDAWTALGNSDEARNAIETAMGPLLRRLKGLVGTSYARQFLTEVPNNSRLVSLAEGLGLVPDNIYTLLESSA